MRATVHLFSRRDAPSLRALMQPMLATRYGSSPFSKQLPGLDVTAICRHARGLATDTPLSRVELGRYLSLRFPGYPKDALAYTATYLEPMVQVPPRGVWDRRGPVRWQTFQGWIGVDADQPARAEDLVLRYLAAFGPASVPDIRVWSGLPALREVVDRLAPQLRVFRDQDGHELYDLPDAPRPDPDTPAPIRFLPSTTTCSYPTPTAPGSSPTGDPCRCPRRRRPGRNAYSSTANSAPPGSSLPTKTLIA